MPIVRLSRDKRGLDTIYLIDTAPEAGRRSGGARVLYFWTAPPGLRVGRTALDESAQRALQRAYPDITFDWPALLKAVEAARAQGAALSVDPRREAWRGAGRTPRAGQRQTGRADAPPLTVSPTAPPDPAAGTESDADASAVQADRHRANVDARPAEAADPAGDGHLASEDGTAAGRRPRRRRRRSKRSGTGDESPSAADPIIES